MDSPFCRFAAALFVALALHTNWCSAAEDASTVDYSRQIKPLLAKHCAKCHGVKEQNSGLRVDSGRALFDGGDTGPAIVPRDSAKSLLVQAVTGTGGVSKMPPEGSPLSPEEIDLIRKWIDAGAPFPTDEVVEIAKGRSNDHWSFQPIRHPAPPAVAQPEATRGPLDSFIVARLEHERIAPSPEANRETLIRRVTLDLLGIPPTPDELREFLADDSPDAYERLIDRLLASPHFGERWGRDWLDVARYADSNGFTRDMPRTIWKYRDWVVDAFNRNQPFDEFVIDQIAGDMRPNARLDQLVATGFHRNTLINEEGGTDPEQFRVESVVDRVNTTGTVFLGLTVGCAQCHDHKYDPISQREYYQLYAFFNSTAFSGGDPTLPRIDVPSPDQIAGGEPERQKAIRAEIAKLDKEIKSQADAIAADLAEWEKTLSDDDKKKLPFNVKNAVDLPLRDRSATHKRDLDAYFRSQDVARQKYPQLERIAKLRAEEPKFPTTMITRELAKPRETYIQLRGNFLRKGAKVHPAVPAVLGRVDGSGLSVEGVPDESESDTPSTASADSTPATASVSPGSPSSSPAISNPQPSTLNHAQPSTALTRLDLARWLVSTGNPLTARVTANRIWQKFFGRGLVETENDFGTQGTPPSHPELLDWLAAEFRGDVFGVPFSEFGAGKNADAGLGSAPTEHRSPNPEHQLRSPLPSWDIKRLQRLIVTSATYRQSSRHRAELAQVDPVNRLLARQNRLRLDAEIIRDESLAAAGLLTAELGGPPVYPPQPDGVFDFTQDKKPWKTATNRERYRKAMYTHLWRSSLYPAMTVFDFPDANITCTRRVRSNTPLQSLTLANDLTFVEFAKGLASRILSESTADDSQRLTLAFELSLSRAPSSAELSRMRDYLHQQQSHFATDTNSAAEFAPQPLPASTSAPAAAAWTSVARVLMNLDEFITRE
jgi:mono/diheme cytochrome c family protein